MNSTQANQHENPCDPIVQQARQDALDALYLEDGRSNREHPLHSLYTGLFMSARACDPDVN